MQKQLHRATYIVIVYSSWKQCDKQFIQCISTQAPGNSIDKKIWHLSANIMEKGSLMLQSYYTLLILLLFSLFCYWKTWKHFYSLVIACFANKVIKVIVSIFVVWYLFCKLNDIVSIMLWGNFPLSKEILVLYLFSQSTILTIWCLAFFTCSLVHMYVKYLLLDLLSILTKRFYL